MATFIIAVVQHKFLEWFRAARQKVLSVRVQLKVIWLRGIIIQPTDKRNKLNKNNNKTKQNKKM